MSINRFARAAVAAIALTGVIVGVGLAQTFDRRTYFTFSGPVAIPGATLPQGEYLFRLADSTSRDVVQVLSADGTHPYAMFFAVRTERADPASEPEVQFMETAEGMPAAIQTWWYPAERTGYEFVYPREQARRLAMGVGQPVLTTAEETITPAETGTGDLARMAPERPARPALPGRRLQRGQVAPPSIPVPETSPQARADLPRTASALPFAGLSAVAFLLGAALIRGVRARLG